MKKSRDEFRDRLDTEISRIFEKLFIEIEQRLKEPLTHLNEKAEQLAPCVEEANRIRRLAEDI